MKCLSFQIYFSDKIHIQMRIIYKSRSKVLYVIYSDILVYSRYRLDNDFLRFLIKFAPYAARRH